MDHILKAAILTIGDEILIGQIVNTNSAFLGDNLTRLGYDVSYHLSLGDNEQQIRDEVEKALSNHDVVITTGGLGPTHDDITKKVMYDIFGGNWIRNDQQYDIIKSLFAKRNRAVTPMNAMQADVPDTCNILINDVGTAPGMWFSKNKCDLFVLPGVPKEMKYLTTERINPILREKNKEQFIVQRTLRTQGMPESFLAEKIGDVHSFLPNQATLAFLPSFTGVKLRVMIKGENFTYLEQQLTTVCTHLIAVCGDCYYGEDEEEIEDLVVRLLKEKKKTISVAESCTGGLISNKLTNISGVSENFMAAVTAYANQAKIDLLGVKEETIEKFGAVSEQVALEMAKGVREKNKTSIGISTTGIAGPTGGTLEKPIGLVWIGYADEKQSFAKKYNFPGDREMIKERASVSALAWVREILLKS